MVRAALFYACKLIGWEGVKWHELDMNVYVVYCRGGGSEVSLCGYETCEFKKAETLINLMDNNLSKKLTSM
jgi:hypothetical protein